ncbi:hypothetical protein COCVIDRAFT_96725 [Bipolaris victoriae FI3]|uniref:Uncharacterized protein n=1 Tax=Bipolaris victoriae (strain FI3) TaxID=930091 RepID=W7EVL7_BIPV3|nr:hypothetical protein COCVIDRAFT_96725 [Bipolaris victoriae FI3]
MRLSSIVSRNCNAVQPHLIIGGRVPGGLPRTFFLRGNARSLIALPVSILEQWPALTQYNPVGAFA